MVPNGPDGRFAPTGRFPIAGLPALIATGEIVGAATIIGAQHALLTAAAHSLARLQVVP